MNSEYNSYREELLQAQFKISESVCHNLSKGEIREDFLTEMIENDFPKFRISSGVLVDDIGKQSPQCDCIISMKNSYFRRLGKKELLDVTDCKVIMEVKSNATARDLSKFNKDCGVIKSLIKGENVLCGLFCYRVKFSKINLFDKLGFKYHKDIDAFDNLLNDNNKKDFGEKVKYPNIDFVMSIHKEADEELGEIDNQFFIQRDGYQYLILPEQPIIQHFFNYLKRIL